MIERVGPESGGASGAEHRSECSVYLVSLSAGLGRLYAAPASIPKTLETARVEESGGSDRPLPPACAVQPHLEGRVLGGLNRG